MAKVNAGRVVLAGLVAGLVVNVIDFVVNVPILGQQWAAATTAVGVRISDVGGQSTAGWIVVDFIAGVFTAWLYGAVLPRYGGGAKTGLIAGFAVWLLEHVALSSLAFLGLYPAGLILSSAVGGLVANLAGGFIAAKLYRD